MRKSAAHLIPVLWNVEPMAKPCIGEKWTGVSLFLFFFSFFFFYLFIFTSFLLLSSLCFVFVFLFGLLYPR